MKTFFPRNIPKGLFAGMTINIGFFQVSIIQLFVLAIGIGFAVGIFSMLKETSTFLGILLAIFIFLIFAIIAFFKISEMGIIQFIAKIIRNNFFDTTKKFQVDYPRLDKTEIVLLHRKENQKYKKPKNIQAKGLNNELLNKLEQESLL